MQNSGSYWLGLSITTILPLFMCILMADRLARKKTSLLLNGRSLDYQTSGNVLDIEQSVTKIKEEFKKARSGKTKS